MKNSPIILIAIGCVSAASMPGFALAMTPAADLANRIVQADANHDGFITRPEFVTYRAAQFDALDRNHDGFISDDDLPGFARAAAAGERLRRLKKDADLNGDTRISHDEWLKAPTPGFDQIDKDGNGVIDPYELKRERGG